MPWWAPIGGLAGAVAVYTGLTMVDKIGAGPFNGLIITANILGAANAIAIATISKPGTILFIQYS